jgi:hypothetical protein
VTTKYLAKFQSPRAITRPKIIGPEQNVNLICNLSLYTHIPNIKSISQSIAKKSVDNCLISELRTWVTLCGWDIKRTSNKKKNLYSSELFFLNAYHKHYSYICLEYTSNTGIVLMTFNFSVSHTATVLSLPPLKIQIQGSIKHHIKASVSCIYFIYHLLDTKP